MTSSVGAGADYYTVLGVDKNASADDIKKAYRKLSMLHHPDRNQADTTELFQQISQAYATLGDPDKRKLYDMEARTRSMHFDGAPDFGGAHTIFIDPADFINMMFGGGGAGFAGAGFGGAGFGSGAGFGGGANGVFNMETLRNNLAKPPPIMLTEQISLQKAFAGGTIPLQVTRWIMEQGTRREETETVYLTIPRGVDHNELLILRDKGHVMSEQLKGDVKVFIKVTNDTAFVRDGLDLHFKKTISLKEALCGFSFDLEHVDGRVFKINNGAGHIVNNSYRKTIPKLGMVRDEHTGSLLIEFVVRFPESLTAEQIEQLRAILPS